MKVGSAIAGVIAGIVAVILVAVAGIVGVASTPRDCSVDPGVGVVSVSTRQATPNVSLEQAIAEQTAGNNKLAASMHFGTQIEAEGKSLANTNFHSYGPYQIQNPSDDPVPRVVHPKMTIADAMDPAKSTAYMLPAYKTALAKQLKENPGLWTSDPLRAAARTAYLAERPKVDYYVNRSRDIPRAWTATLAAMTRTGLSTQFDGGTPVTALTVAAPQQPAATATKPDCQRTVMAGGPVGQPGIISGDAATLAKRVLALSPGKIQFTPGFGGRADFQATAEGRLVEPGSGGGCSSRRPQPVSAAVSQIILDIVEKGGYSITLGSTISSHSCDGGRHPTGRAIDINYINGKVISGNTAQFTGPNRALIAEFMDFVLTILPKGQWSNGKPVGMGGLGQQQCFGTPRPEITGLNIFPDTCHHIHIDAGAFAEATA